ncbi:MULTISPECIES: M48 family metalloprotease [unclassified Acinetobacter]|uniref:M48 family metalloprotease n=1 Tax=unclassified Acinetobacter TaxID=196816 RepID=UPI00293410C3|nr:MULTISPECIES: M48 family metalloprotease [unclassified Acinetobacter]WOE31718.1 M48 family metalloprotease [Acinetobacter sp. SAAs470]WOE37185.1 M48 family metalloprotease [Acinetobacter sp. SAAs474]
MNDVSYFGLNDRTLFWAIAVWFVALVLTLLILNALLGVMVYYFDPSQAIFWNDHSLHFLMFLLGLMSLFLLRDAYIFRDGGHSFATHLKARRIHFIESTPEEHQALKITSELAEKFSIDAPALYVLADEIGVNAFTAGFHTQDTVIILTWGALQNLDEYELYGLLGHEFNRILSGETVENTQLKILYSCLTTLSLIGSKIAKQGFNRNCKDSRRKFSTLFVACGGFIWLVGSLGILMTRFFKYITLRGRTFKDDLTTKQLLQNDANIQTLLRISVQAEGSQIYSEYSEEIAHMCYANSLRPQNWLNIHPSIDSRLFMLRPTLAQEISWDCLTTRHHLSLLTLFKSWQELDEDVYKPLWSSPKPLPLLRLSPISFAIKDAIKPLNPEVRENIQRPELIQRAFQTSTGSREVMIAILMIRQYREFIPADANVSRAIVDELLRLDGRYHISIFHEACRNIGPMPDSIARQFVTKLAHIIQEDGEIGLLDALLLECVKDQLKLLPQRVPKSFIEVKPNIVRLIDALLHVQQINSENQLHVREDILKRILTPEELENYQEISDEPIDLAEVLQDMAGLLLRERLIILADAELCLWSDRIITQDELDVLELLYWRLGFETKEIIEIMHKKNSLIII